MKKRGGAEEGTPRPRYDFEKMKAAATSDSRVIRKRAFIEYFERFAEFPSYLFDNERAADERLLQTIRDISEDEATGTAMRAGIEALQHRLPS
jgi:hypothetical protein